MTKEEYLAYIAQRKQQRGRNKYNNRKVDGYDSTKERDRAAVLRLLQRAGEISDLQEQVRVEIIPAQFVDGKKVEERLEWIADFVYTDNLTGQKVYEDTKGFKTRDYINKRKMLLYLHGIRIKET